MNHAFDVFGKYRIDRRAFLHMGAAAAASVAATARPAGAWEPTAASSVAGKDPRLIVHTALPAVLETPPALLIAERVTPTAAVVRAQQPAAARYGHA